MDSIFDDFCTSVTCEEYYNNEEYDLERELDRYDYSLSKEQEEAIDNLFR